MKGIGRIIKDTRKIKGLTQEELADLSKVNLRTIQRIEKDQNEPRGKTLALVCNALEINMEMLNAQNNGKLHLKLGSLIINGLYLALVNLFLMMQSTFLTLDSNANINSRVGALLLSFLIPFFIVSLTGKMTGIERVLKFGSGYIIVIIGLMFAQGFPEGMYIGVNTGLFLCLLISIGVLFYGRVFVNPQERKK